MIYANQQDKNNHFISNYIRTTKYTLYNFLFLSLAYQFLRFSNCYFFLIMVLSCTPVSPISPMTSINPVVFVLSMSMLREGFEDFGRYQQDKMQNQQMVKVVDSQTRKISKIYNKDLKVGDICVIE